MRRPSGLNAALLTLAWWPVRTRSSWPLSASQMRAVLSVEAVTMRRPSGLNAALLTLAWWPVDRSSWPLSASQMRAVLSVEAVTMRRPSGLQAAPIPVAPSSKRSRSASAYNARSTAVPSSGTSPRLIRMIFLVGCPGSAANASSNPRSGLPASVSRIDKPASISARLRCAAFASALARLACSVAIAS